MAFGKLKPHILFATIIYQRLIIQFLDKLKKEEKITAIRSNSKVEKYFRFFMSLNIRWNIDIISRRKSEATRFMLR